MDKTRTPNADAHQDPATSVLTPEGPPPEPSDASATDPAAAIQRERDEYRDRLLRTAAEFENYRKRVERDRRDQADTAVAEVLRELLPIIDDFERALASTTPAVPDAFRAGIELIHKQLLQFLRARGVKPIEALGADFDPHVHQAVAHEASPGHREGEVIAEHRRGYMLADRLLRPAMVKVAKGE